MDPMEKVACDPAALRAPDSPELECQLDVARRREPRQQRRLLKHQGHVSVHVGTAAGWPLQPREHVEQSALARAGGAHHADELAALDLERRRLQSDELFRVVRKRHRQRLDADRVLVGEFQDLAHDALTGDWLWSASTWFSSVRS